MKKTTFIYSLSVLLFVLITNHIQAQITPFHAYNDHYELYRTRFEPAYLGNNGKKFEANLMFNFNLWAGNNFMKVSTINAFASNNLTNSLVEQALGDMRSTDNRIGLGLSVQWLSAKFRADNTFGEEIATFSFEINERFDASMSFSKNIAEFLWYGNKRFAGQNINLGGFYPNMLAYREFVLGGARDVLNNGTLRLRAAVRLKYLVGIAAARTESSNFIVNTAPDGSYIDFSVGYKAQYANANEEFSYKRAGGGFGTDLGITATYQENLKVSLSVLDIGSINFNQNTGGYERRDTTFRFDGILVNTSGVSSNNSNNVIDSLQNIITGKEIKGGSFSQKLPTRLSLQAEYTLPSGTENAHHFFFTYIQGFSDIGLASRRPFFSLGYVYQIRNQLNLGLTPSWGGYNNLSLGSFISYAAGPFRVGFGTNNLMSLISFSQGKSFDLTFNLGFNISQKTD
ncbi:MAG: hypothetical protein EAZ55_07590 [Cytophagales bacterium]|nr:MAG: hypothetical protein EAZ55_07590 [Cytophagales bacterium]